MSPPRAKPLCFHMVGWKKMVHLDTPTMTGRIICGMVNWESTPQEYTSKGGQIGLRGSSTGEWKWSASYKFEFHPWARATKNLSWLGLIRAGNQNIRPFGRHSRLLVRVSFSLFIGLTRHAAYLALTIWIVIILCRFHAWHVMCHEGQERNSIHVDLLGGRSISQKNPPNSRPTTTSLPHLMVRERSLI